MLKKLLIFPLIGGLMTFGAFASADSNGSFTVKDLRDGNGNYLGKGCVYTNSSLDSSVVSSYNSCLIENYIGIPPCNSSANASSITVSDLPLCSSILDTPSDSDNSSVFPTIPDSFTSGITALVNNFGSVIVGWLPTIILVALGITAIFSLFRVVRGYARSSFRG